ncbi:PDZ-binding protein [Lactarius deliciosus]|nr:PDZ-binding protein [Lactarius deliciosus]KAH9166345.1 PDZ-binding protein [Lactarius sanguifluus]
MVCTRCEKKLSKVAAPDPFQSTSASIKDGSRKIGENKLIGRPKPPGAAPSSSRGISATSSKNRYQPYAGKCKDCKQSVSQNQAKYCHGCAFKKGICSICGKQILDTSGYQMVNK